MAAGDSSGFGLQRRVKIQNSATIPNGMKFRNPVSVLQKPSYAYPPPLPENLNEIQPFGKALQPNLR